MQYKYHYVGGHRIHVAGVAGFVEPDTDVVSEVEIKHPHFKSLNEKPVEKVEEKEETKKKKK